MPSKKAPAKRLTVEEIRAQVEQKRADALKHQDKMRQRADDLKQQLKNPPKQYVDLPDSTGNAEADSAADLQAVESGFNKRRADDEARFAKAVDSGFYAALCFRTREQRDAFMSNLGILHQAHIATHFFDGVLVARHMGMQLPDAGERVRNKPPDSEWASFVWSAADLKSVKPLKKSPAATKTVKRRKAD